MYQVRKVSDEGTSTPFIARFFGGIIGMRDQLFLLDIPPADQETVRNQFDKKYKPLQEAAQAVRDAAIEINKLISTHLEANNRGEIVHFRATQYDILKTIDIPLGQSVDKLINQSIVATKTCLQSILKEPLGLDISFFFQKETQFNTKIEEIRKLGDNTFAQYLYDVRNNWHEALQELRAQQEHQGWTLEMIDYHLVAQNKVEITLPNILDIPVDTFATLTANRVLLFIENMMIYSMQLTCRFPIYIIEIPPNQRDPKNIERFRLAPMGLDSSLPWQLEYKDENDFV